MDTGFHLNETERSKEFINLSKSDTPAFFQGLKREKNDLESIFAEVSYPDKVYLQNKEISAVESGNKDFNRGDTHETGNYGEMKTDQSLRELGYERISNDMVLDIKEQGRQGIDGVYYNSNGHPQYIVVESKYGTSQLNPETKDGKQMSESWIEKRLDSAVGKEKADEIRMVKLFESENYGAYPSRVASNGKVNFDKLDANANVVKRDVKINE